ncbi:MAG: hypothetical protein CSA68_02130 [Rhodobacterales bacterium]|nr:MAG: hypothetical protein CSA68_02130 [Rhodobacterales bacterium]
MTRGGFPRVCFHDASFAGEGAIVNLFLLAVGALQDIGGARFLCGGSWSGAAVEPGQGGALGQGASERGAL